MAEETEEDEGPVVALGEGESVEGAPVARVASRLSWPIEKSEVVRKEGDAVIRTPDGPQSLADVVADVETTYFDTRRTFLSDVRAVIGEGPVPTDDQ